MKLPIYYRGSMKIVSTVDLDLGLSVLATVLLPLALERAGDDVFIHRMVEKAVSNDNGPLCAMYSASSKVIKHYISLATCTLTQ